MRAINVAVLALISVPSFAQDPGWDRMTQAQQSSANCLLANSVRLDDGETSPEVIARAARRACKSEIEAFRAAFLAKGYEMVQTDPHRTRDARFQAMFLDLIEDLESLAIQAILENRVRDR